MAWPGWGGVVMSADVADLVIRGGTVVDGTGAPARAADVAVTAGSITAIGPKLSGRTTLDATGQVVAPGFIDVHTHYDAQVFWDPALTPSSWHGVTSVIAGNCGFSIAPCRPHHRGLMARTLEHVEDMNLRALEAGVPWDFETFPEYLDAVERQGTALNFGVYVGHTAVRLWVMGDDAYERAATDDEITAMRDLVREAVSSGAIGFSTSSAPTHNGDGGRPVPSRLADVSELEALLSVLGELDRGVAALLPGERIGHADVYSLQRAVGRPFTWTALLTFPGGLHEMLVDIHEAQRREGAQVWPQVSGRPLLFQMTLAEPFMFATRPIFAELLAVGIEERAARYADPSWRARAQDALEASVLPIRWEKLSVAESRVHPELVGRSIADLAAERGTGALDVMAGIALDENLETRFRVTVANDDTEAVARLLRRDDVILGLSDAGAHASQLCDACFSTDLLGTWVREREVLSVERAVRRLTGEVADVFGLDRGYLRPGCPADITVFDPATVAAGPLKRVRDLPAGADRLVADSPSGITHVLVNGTCIQRDGEWLLGDGGLRPGEMLRGS